MAKNDSLYRMYMLEKGNERRIVWLDDTKLIVGDRVRLEKEKEFWDVREVHGIIEKSSINRSEPIKKVAA